MAGSRLRVAAAHSQFVFTQSALSARQQAVSILAVNRFDRPLGSRVLWPAREARPEDAVDH